MNNKISKTLEFEKIKQQLQNFAATDQGIDKIQALRPEIDQVVALQNETEDGRKVLRLKGGIPMPRLKSIRSHLKRLEIGGTLNGKEIAEIGRVLSTTKRNHPVLPMVRRQRDFLSFLSWTNWLLGWLYCRKSQEGSKQPSMKMGRSRMMPLPH